MNDNAKIIAALKARVQCCEEMLAHRDPELGKAYWEARRQEALVCLYLAEDPDRTITNECAVVVVKDGTLTVPEADLVAHALGWPRLYRNFFAASESAHVAAWENLSARGLAYERKNTIGPDRLFVVSSAGLDAFNRHMAQRRAG